MSLRSPRKRTPHKYDKACRMRIYPNPSESGMSPTDKPPRFRRTNPRPPTESCSRPQRRLPELTIKEDSEESSIGRQRRPYLPHKPNQPNHRCSAKSRHRLQSRVPIGATMEHRTEKKHERRQSRLLRVLRTDGTTNRQHSRPRGSTTTSQDRLISRTIHEGRPSLQEQERFRLNWPAMLRREELSRTNTLCSIVNCSSTASNGCGK